MKYALLILFMCCSSLFTANSTPAGEISVLDPWIREAPPVAKVLAAFMTIKNDSPRTVQLDSVACADFAMVEIHQTTTHDGMAHMLKQSSLPIESGGSVVLKPGGYHLMLMQAKRALKAGDKIGLQLHFNTGESVEVIAVVRKQ